MKILVAEEDAAYCRLLEAMLGSWGYQVIVCQNGEQAAQILAREDGPSLAVLNGQMSGMNGIETCRRIRHSQSSRYVYILLLTSLTEKEDLEQFIAAGIDDYIVKPCHEKEIEIRIRAARRIVELEQALRNQVTHDAVTGIWNRATVTQFLDREIIRAHRHNTGIAVIMVDIDQFKGINDLYGHPVGDHVLHEVAMRMRPSIRGYDGFGRYGGEEFLIVLSGGNLSGATILAERLRHLLSSYPIKSLSHVISITASFGVVAGIGKILASQELIRLADVALYRAKEKGRNRVESLSLEKDRLPAKSVSH